MVEDLHAASAMREKEQRVSYRDGNLELAVTIPPLGIAAIKLEFAFLARH